MVSGRSGATLASKTFEKLLKLQNPQILDTDRDFESRSTPDPTVVHSVDSAASLELSELWGVPAQTWAGRELIIVINCVVLLPFASLVCNTIS